MLINVPSFNICSRANDKRWRCGRFSSTTLNGLVPEISGDTIKKNVNGSTQMKAQRFEMRDTSTLVFLHGATFQDLHYFKQQPQINIVFETARNCHLRPRLSLCQEFKLLSTTVRQYSAFPLHNVLPVNHTLVPSSIGKCISCGTQHQIRCTTTLEWTPLPMRVDRIDHLWEWQRLEWRWSCRYRW